MKNKKLSYSGENILILLCIIDLVIIYNNNITSINIFIYILYLIKVIFYIRYNKTFKK